jgi:predicted permease
MRWPSWLQGRRRRDAELGEEIRAHLEMGMRDRVGRGESAEQAAYGARREFGNVGLVKEITRATWGWGSLEILGQDLRYAGRMLRRSPGFTAVAVLSLGIGIGANTALFSLTDAVLLRMLPVKNPSELVLFKWASGQNSLARSIDGETGFDEATGRVTSTSFSYLTFQRFHDQSATLADVFAFAPIEQLNVVVDGAAEIASGQVVTGGYYGALGVRAIRGRTITPDDDEANASPVAVITQRYWERRFGADPAVVGKSVRVDGLPVTIVGITAREFGGTLQVGDSPDLTLPMSMDPALGSHGRSNLTDGGFWWVRMMGRLKPGATREKARAELERVFQQAAIDGRTASAPKDEPPGTKPRDLPRLSVVSGGQGLTELRADYARPLGILTIVVGLVLLIACANVANLLLARAANRQREMTVRLAVGAGRWRIVRQLLTESLLLAFLGGTLGVALAYWGKHLLMLLRPWGGAELVLDLTLDLRVLAVAAAISMLTGIVFGLAPALRAGRVDLAPSLRDSLRSLSGLPRSILAHGLVVTQVALSVVLLIEAGLFVRTLRNLHGVELGFNAENLLVFRVDPRLNGYTGADIDRLYTRILERVAAVPGVRGVTLSRHPQLANSSRRDRVYVRGHPLAPGKRTITPINLVGPHFFQTFQLPVVLGRAISARDDEHAPRVAVVNETLARTYFAGESPIGKRLGFGNPDSSAQFEIVGVAKDAKYYNLRSPAEPIVYLPYFQDPAGQASFTVRTNGDAAAATPAIRLALRDVDPNIPIFDVRTQRETADETLTQERLFAELSSLFGVVAVVLACVGVYGVMSYSTARRTNEIGLRIALGARTRDIIRLVMQHTMLLVVLGAATGLALAVAASHVVESMLFGLTTTDPATIAAAVLLIVGVAALAGYLPARRARRVSPMVALRSD